MWWVAGFQFLSAGLFPDNSDKRDTGGASSELGADDIRARDPELAPTGELSAGQ